MNNKDFNLFSHFDSQFKQHNAKILLTTEKEIAYSYQQIDNLTARIANYLVELGVKPGDRISTQLDKSPESLSLYLACLRAGLIFHPLNPAYSIHELGYFIDNAKPAIIVCNSINYPNIQGLKKADNFIQVETLDADGSGSLLEKSAHYPSTFETIARAENDAAALLYSSGTTGVPKGIILSHGNLLSNAQSLKQQWAFTAEDCLLHCLPTFHVHGLFISLGCVLLAGASMRWLASFKTTEVIKYLPECTVMMGVPTYYTRLLDEPLFTQQSTTNIRVFISGSAPLKAETFYTFEQRTGHRILERYGMTETNINTSNPLDGERKPGTVGLALANVEIRIVDDNNQPQAIGEIGNLQVRGPNVFKGYWQMANKTNQSFTEDLFFDTGDKGQIDEDGYLSIVGRSKDLIICGGLNVYPKEIELLIDALPGIKESAVIGVAHSDFGEAVVAVIVQQQNAALNELDIISQIKEKLANFKVPKKVITVDELPRNTMGKVQKNNLRERYKLLLSED